jgi:ABC-2 type transport system ATP-binding protein
MSTEASTNTVIESRGLARTFKTRTGPVQAVCGVDFHVARGEIVGFLGPNGAGKSTTQRMLATLLAPTAGEATIAGCDLRRDPNGVRRRIGYVAQSGTTNPSALATEELVLQARLYGIDRQRAEARAKEMLAQLDLADLGARLIKTLSGGQRRRLDIALGLVHQPQVVFLDEPSTGLDPQTRANLWQHIRALRGDQGATVFLTTHYLDEADALCDRILIIDRGRIVAAGTPDELKRRISGDLVTFTVAATEVERGRALVAGQPGVREVATRAETVQVTVDRGDERALVLMRALDGGGVRVVSMQISRPTLDDVFLTLTGHSLREAAA